MASSIRAAERQMNSGIRMGNQRLDALGEGAAVQHGTTGLLGVHDFSVSSIKVGMNRSAISSSSSPAHAPGKYSFASGRSRLSMASVSNNRAGRVVNRLVPAISAQTRTASRIAYFDTLNINVQNPHCTSGSSAHVTKEQVQQCKMTMGTMGFELFKNHLAGICAILCQRRQKRNGQRSAPADSAQQTARRWKSWRPALTSGSQRLQHRMPGKCDRSISLHLLHLPACCGQ